MEGHVASYFRNDSSLGEVIVAGESPQPMVNEVDEAKDGFDMLIECVYHMLMW